MLVVSLLHTGYIENPLLGRNWPAVTAIGSSRIVSLFYTNFYVFEQPSGQPPQELFSRYLGLKIVCSSIAGQLLLGLSPACPLIVAEIIVGR